MRNLPRMLLGTLLVLAAATRTHAIQLNVQAGSDWDVTVTWSGVAGENLVASYESAANQVGMRVRQADDPFHVYVSRSDTTWHANLHLYVRRITTGGDLVGGLAYQEIGTSDAEFFYSTTSANTGWLDCQLQLTGVSVAIGAQDFLTEVIYTVTEDF